MQPRRWTTARTAGTAAAMAMAATLGGCASAVTFHSYAPRPGTVVVGDAATPGDSARVLASIVAVRREDPKAGKPATVEVRMIVRNTGEGAVSLDPNAMRLVSADLLSFGAPTPPAQPSVNVSPGQESALTLYFPTPGEMRLEQFDLDSLTLTWTMRLGDRPHPCAVQFLDRAPRDFRYGDPLRDYPYGPGPYRYGPRQGWVW